MVEGIHVPFVLVEAVSEGVAVPALPYRCRPLVDAVEPRRVLTLQEQAVGQVVHSIERQRLHQNACADKPGGQSVAVLLDVLTK